MSKPGNPQGASQNRLPDPLQTGGWLSRLGTLAPPAVALSFASVAVGVSVFGFLQRNADLRGLFKIAVTDRPAIDNGIRLGLGLFTAVLAWAIVLRCRRRPGPLWPRYWALGLALAASALSAVQILDLWPAQTPRLDAASLACLAAALALWPRLLRLHPDSRLVQAVAPLSLLLVLSLILPAVYYMGGDVIAVWKHGLGSAASAMRDSISVLRQCGQDGMDCGGGEFKSGVNELERVASSPLWREAAVKLRGNPELEQRYGELLATQGDLLAALSAELPRRLNLQLKALAEDRPGLGVDAVADFKALLPVAAMMGRADSLKPALVSMADALIRAQVPPLDESPVIFTAAVNENGPWEPNPGFAESSRAAIARYLQIRSLFMGLGGAVEGDDPALKPLQEEFRRQSSQGWKLRLLALEGDWASHWLLPYFLEPPLPAGAMIPTTPLKIVLNMPVMGGLAASDVGGLLSLSRTEAERLFKERRTANCVKIQKDRVLRFDCRTYVATAKDKTALRVELRLIYDGRKSADKPDRLFYLLPVPAGVALENFAYETGRALPEAQEALQKLLGVIDLQKSLQPEAALQIPSQCPPSSGAACAEVWEFIKGSGQQYLKLVIYRH